MLTKTTSMCIHVQYQIQSESCEGIYVACIFLDDEELDLRYTIHQYISNIFILLLKKKRTWTTPLTSHHER